MTAGRSGDATSSVFIQAVNDAPIAPSNPISLTAGTEDTAYTIKAADLLNGFSDIDGDTLSVVNLSSSSGVLQDNADGTYTLTPTKDFNGSIGLTYQVSDGTDTTDASRSVFITAVNDAPIAPSSPISLTAGTEDTAYTIQASDLLQGFSDVEGDSLSVINLSSSSGFLQDNADGTYTLTPTKDFNGSIGLTYQVSDGTDTTDASRSVFIQAVNDAPVAPSSPISLTAGTEDTAYTIQASDLLQGFSDVDGDTLSVINLSSSSGFLQDNADGTYTLTPNANFNGSIGLTYQVSDGTDTTDASSSVFIQAVNDAPIAPSSPISLASGTEDTAYTIKAADLLNGFSDIDSPSLSVINLSSSSGFLQDNADGTYTLTPNANFNGNIGLTYQVSDSHGGVVDASNSVFIQAVNDAPIAPSSPMSLASGTEDTAYTINSTDLLQGFSDVEGDTLSVINLSSSSGFLQDNQDGTYTLTPNANFNGNIGLTYQVSDGTDTTDASRSVFITAVNDAPIAPSSPISLTAGTEDTAYTIQASDLLQGFSDIDSPSLSVINLSSSSGVLQDNADGTYTLTPTKDFNGSIGLTYQVSDGTDTTDASRSVFIQAVNDAPIAPSSPISLTAGTEDTAYTINASDLLQGFSDIDSPSLSVINLSSSSGFLQDNADGTYTLTPTKDFNGSIGLTYQVSDGTDTTDASRSVFITAVNDAPVAPSSPMSLASGTEDTAYTINASDLLQGFSDVDGDTLSVVNLTSSSGFLQDNADGTYTLTPNAKILTVALV